MIKNLVIVESPAKAKTIEGFLGKDFMVKSCFGHIRDLSKDRNGVLIENNFEPIYEISPDKKALVSELKKLAKDAETVWLASDEDREGEAISWHLSEALGLKSKDTKRIVFHEITKPAILKAIENPREINQELVDAQQARRILDRIVGFELSPVLWKKVKPSLSAGRVQSVAVRLIVDREREINEFDSKSFFKVTAEFNKNGKTFKAELSKKFNTEEEAKAFLEKCKNAKFTVNSVDVKPAKRNPASPFTTSTLQQEASRKLSFSVSQTMAVAQKLYEHGFITYMRTDSVNLSETALDASKKEILQSYGQEYFKQRKYATKTANAQEAHEAIRPTYFENHTVEGDYNEKRLYELIWKRSIASQMSEAEFEKTIIKIHSDNIGDLEFVTEGEVLKFDGFLKVYLESTDDENDEEEAGTLPAVSKGDVLQNESIHATERFTKAAARYTEASLVKKLEELGIGRPSTYAPTISTVQRRGYVVKEDREGRERNYQSLSLVNNQIKTETKTETTGAEKAKLFPNDIGILVTDFLFKHFPQIMDYQFTAKVEKEFDEIAEGLQKWTKMLAEFYKPFHKTVEQTTNEAERVTGERELGKHPETGKTIITRMARFGPVVQIGSSDDEEKPQFANLRQGQTLESITLEEALELFRLPRIAGQFEGKDMKVAIGRFGPYIQHNSKFISLPKGTDPYTVNEEECIEIIKNKRIVEANKLIKKFEEDPEVQLLNGRWGPYISQGKANYKIPKAQHKDVAKLSFDEVMELIKSQETPAKIAANKKASAKAAKESAPKKPAAKKAKKPVAKKAAAKKTAKKK